MIQISVDTWSPGYSTEKVRVKEGRGRGDREENSW